MLTFASSVIDQDGYNYEVDFEGVMAWTNLSKMEKFYRE